MGNFGAIVRERGKILAFEPNPNAIKRVQKAFKFSLTSKWG
jgi:hypothetical protein